MSRKAKNPGKMIINPDTNTVFNVINAIKRNNGHCPCQTEVSENTLCPCTDFYNNECHCNLFIYHQEDE